MEKLNFIKAIYIESHTRTHGVNSDSMQEFLKNGYHIAQRRREYYVLVKPARINVILQDSTGKVFKYNAKQDILNFYNKKQISKSLFEQFHNEATNGNIFFYLDNGVVNLGRF